MATPKTVHFDLDAFERDETPEPFVVQLGKKTYTLHDYNAMDYRDVLTTQDYFRLGQAQKAIEVLVQPADRLAFFSNPIPNYKLIELFEQYNAHFNIPEPGEVPASPES